MKDREVTGTDRFGLNLATFHVAPVHMRGSVHRDLILSRSGAFPLSSTKDKALTAYSVFSTQTDLILH